jgi:predicted nucleotidyltransferase component of viral defense system
MNRAEQIKRLAIVAMVSDDDLMNRIVLKGGNALDLVYGVAPRSSLDLDFSVEGEFVVTETLSSRIRDNFTRVFGAKGLTVFDFKAAPRP